MFFAACTALALVAASPHADKDHEVVTPDEARTQQNLLFVERGSGDTRRSVYTDELLRTPEGWRIARRRCQFIVAGGLSDRPDE